MIRSKMKLLLVVGLCLATYACQKESNDIEVENKEEANETRRGAVNYLTTLDMKAFNSVTKENMLGLTIFLNKEAMESSADSAVVLVMQKGIEQVIPVTLLGQENLSNYMFGEDKINPKYDMKLEFDVKISFYNTEKATLLGTQDVSMNFGVSSFSDKGEKVSNKYIPGIYPICLMFDSTQINKKDAYKFTFVGMIVEGDSTVKFDNASESSKTKKMLMTWDRKHKIPSNYLKGQGYYPDMNIMMLGVDDLGSVFYEAMQNNQEVKFALQNNYNYWNLATTASSYDKISLKKIRNPGGGTGNGGGEQRLKTKMKTHQRIN